MRVGPSRLACRSRPQTRRGCCDPKEKLIEQVSRWELRRGTKENRPKTHRKCNCWQNRKHYTRSAKQAISELVNTPFLGEARLVPFAVRELWASHEQSAIGTFTLTAALLS